MTSNARPSDSEYRVTFLCSTQVSLESGESGPSLPESASQASLVYPFFSFGQSTGKVLAIVERLVASATSIVSYLCDHHRHGRFLYS